MIRRKGKDTGAVEFPEPKGFDAFDLRLGDVMRGERATLGKSLLDVQRELKIKAAYIAAIENCDPSAFDTPGFIAGYVRSYARYLGMDPDRAFQHFCDESGFSVAHGMAPEASSRRRSAAVISGPDTRPLGERNLFTSPNTPFTPVEDGVFSGIEPGAVGSSLVLLAVIGLLGFGGWSVVQEVQRVQIAPVDQTPVAVSEIDPLQPAGPEGGATELAGTFEPPEEALDRLYRPQALDVPVLIARDAPIASLDPNEGGVFANAARRTDAPPNVGPEGSAPVIVAESETPPQMTPQVVAEEAPAVALFAVRPAWVRVRAVDGSVIFEKILDAGEEFVLPQTEGAPTLRAGNSGSLFFKVAGEVYGPAGSGTSVAKNVALSVEALRESYAAADLTADPDLARFVAVADAGQ